VGVIGEDPNRVSTIGERGRRVWIYPTWFRGVWLTRRSLVHAFLVVALLAGPWIDVGGHPAMRFDIPGRRIHFWGLNLFATDGSYLLFVAGFVVFAVFLFTALFGRAWCGWACPQTVFLESLVRPLERLIQGTPSRRRALDAAPWGPAKLARKGLTWAGILVISGAVGTTVVAYFIGREGVIQAQFDPWSHPFGTGTFLFITAVTLFDFVWFREQTCLVVCPYGRFQSVLLDGNSLTVGYDVRRGEPRGKRGTAGAGDCIDCRRCVQVCPTGIDIRRGSQMECVQCMACIDACDDVMARLHRPQGLVRFTSERALAGRTQRFLRPRVLAYAVGVTGVLLALLATVTLREPVELRLVRQAGAPFVRMPDGRIQNSLRIRVANKTDLPRAFSLRAVAPSGAELVVPTMPFAVEGGQVQTLPFFLLLTAAPGEHGAVPFSIAVTDDHGFHRIVQGEAVVGSLHGHNDRGTM
jgi:cytochrome c oxidase accessory protein FixG